MYGLVEPQGLNERASLFGFRLWFRTPAAVGPNSRALSPPKGLNSPWPLGRAISRARMALARFPSKDDADGGIQDLTVRSAFQTLESAAPTSTVSLVFTARSSSESVGSARPITIPLMINDDSHFIFGRRRVVNHSQPPRFTLQDGNPSRCGYFNDPQVSSKHLALRAQTGSAPDRLKIEVQDMGSLNGTIVNCMILKKNEWTRISLGDEIFVGETCLTFIETLPEARFSIESGCPSETFKTGKDNDVEQQQASGGDHSYCPVCVTDWTDLTLSERMRHAETCTSSSTIEKRALSPLRCFVCTTNLSGLTDVARNAHVNQCLDKKPVKARKGTKGTRQKRKTTRVSTSSSAMRELDYYPDDDDFVVTPVQMPPLEMSSISKEAEDVDEQVEESSVARLPSERAVDLALATARKEITRLTLVVESFEVVKQLHVLAPPDSEREAAEKIAETNQLNPYARVRLMRRMELLQRELGLTEEILRVDDENRFTKRLRSDHSNSADPALKLWSAASGSRTCDDDKSTEDCAVDRLSRYLACAPHGMKHVMSLPELRSVVDQLWRAREFWEDKSVQEQGCEEIVRGLRKEEAERLEKIGSGDSRIREHVADAFTYLRAVAKEILSSAEDGAKL